MNKPNSIVRLQSHENRTPTGRPSATATRKLVNYLAFGRGRAAHQAQRLQRGDWHDQASKQWSHDEVLKWVQAQGKQHQFTHQLILSVSEAQLDAPAYNDALQVKGESFFNTWHLMAHTDSAHPHAHVVAFSDEVIDIRSARFREWWLAVRLALDNQQQEHLTRQREIGQEVSHELEAGMQKNQVQAGLAINAGMAWEVSQ